jgi:hypothetical protein
MVFKLLTAVLLTLSIPAQPHTLLGKAATISILDLDSPIDQHIEATSPATPCLLKREFAKEAFRKADLVFSGRIKSLRPLLKKSRFLSKIPVVTCLP